MITHYYESFGVRGAYVREGVETTAACFEEGGPSRSNNDWCRSAKICRIAQIWGADHHFSGAALLPPGSRERPVENGGGFITAFTSDKAARKHRILQFHAGRVCRGL